MSAAAAGATLVRAASFWAQRSGQLGAIWHEPDAVVRTRYLANGFRELDGFLCLLLDEVAPGPKPRRRNAANRLGAIARDGFATGDVVAADCDRLRAIGRSVACLFHLSGWVRRPDVAAGGWMTAGWPDADGGLRRYPLGDRLRPVAGDVADVCRFYLRIGKAVRS